MSHIVNQSLAMVAAFVLAITSIGTIVTVPPAHANASIGMVELA